MSESAMALPAPAKVNLALHITGRRPDGHHLLDSIAVFTDLGDTVELARAEHLSLTVSGEFAAHAPGDRSDLAWRAAEAFFTHAGLAPDAAIRIEKRIPAGAGLGGGSADAAAVLTGLNRLYEAGASPDDLAALGLRLGADVPICLAGMPLRARGIGEDIEFLDGWPMLSLVLVWPGTPVSTGSCFGALASRENSVLPPVQPAGGVQDIAGWLAGCRNDLEEPARRLAPVIGDTLASIRATPGCLVARMSGSGSACFGLYATEEAARAAAVLLHCQHPKWWIASALTLSREPEEA